MLGVPLSCMHKLPDDCDEEGCPRHGWDLRCPQPHSSENAVFLFSSIFFQSLYCCFKTRTQVVTLLNVYGQIAHILILCWLWNYNQYHFFLRKDFTLSMGHRLVSNSSVTWGWLEHHHFLLPPPPDCLGLQARTFTPVLHSAGDHTQGLACAR